MTELKNNLAKLVKVKTIVTMTVIAIFAVLAIRGDITADNVMVIVSTVIAFYFGTQHERDVAPAVETVGIDVETPEEAE